MAEGSWGDVLRNARIRARLTQDEVARRARISVRTVRHIEGGHVTPRAATLERMSEVFGYDLVDGGRGPGSSRLPCEVRVLGPMSVRCAGLPVDMPLKQRVLLGLLAVQPDQVVGHEEIADALWGDGAQPGCRHLVYTYVARLRRLITPREERQGVGGRRIRTVHGGYVLNSRGMGLDLCRFDERAARAARAAGADPPAALDLYTQALGCWQGRLLQDLPQLRQHPAVVQGAQRHIDVAIDFADLALSLGRPALVLDQLTVAASEEPLHEALQARIMLVMAATGRRATALRLFDDLRLRLGRELGVEPGDELRGARRAILRESGAGRRDPEASEASRSSGSAGPSGSRGSSGPSAPSASSGLSASSGPDGPSVASAASGDDDKVLTRR
ncbi:BTAD domain-containing putative transcriptional regulator [Streptomyces sp. NPDC101166]|uniref:BTAD domain-containing putative transcriptional regulator n=1 Tax=Streptomyces sp. NPDC101166 TaxID=3366120 RepID=UPI00382FA262